MTSGSSAEDDDLRPACWYLLAKGDESRSTYRRRNARDDDAVPRSRRRLRAGRARRSQVAGSTAARVACCKRLTERKSAGELVDDGADPDNPEPRMIEKNATRFLHYLY